MLWQEVTEESISGFCIFGDTSGTELELVMYDSVLIATDLRNMEKTNKVRRGTESKNNTQSVGP